MKKILIITLAILAFSSMIYSQVYEDPVYESDMGDATELNPSIIYPREIYDSGVIQEKVYDPEPVSVVYSPDVFGKQAANSAAGSFLRENAWSLENNFGFSLGAHEGFYFNDRLSDNTATGSSEKKGSSVTSFSASVFTNYASGRSAMHLGYDTGYSFYPQLENSSNGAGHNVNAAYNYQIGETASFQLTDHLSSSSNDSFSDMFSLNSSFDSILTGSNYYDLILSQRRYTRNTVTASLSSDVTGKGTNVQVYGSYNKYWYGEQDFLAGALKDHYSASIGAGLSQRVTSWLSLGSTYSIQLNNDLRDSQTHRVEVGRFQFDLSPNVEIYASGGVEFTNSDSSDGYRTRIATRAGISYTAETTRLYADYSRTMMSVSGFTQQLPSDTVTAGLGQQVGDRANFRMAWYYQRSTRFNDSGVLSSHQGLVSMEYNIGSGFFASANFTRRYQENSISSLSGIPYSSRSIFSVGLQYAWPSGRRG